MDEVFFISLCLALGVCSGFLGGLLGIGGGLVIVPALILLYDASGRYSPEVATVVAVATSLACIVFTSAAAAYTHYRAGKVRWDLARRLVIFLVAGSSLAGLVAPYLPASLFRVFIGAFLAFVAVVMLSSWTPHPHRRFPGWLGAGGIGLGGGFAAGMAGIAGGNVIVPTLVYFNTPIHNATATASALGVPIAFSAALVYALAPLASAPAGGWGYLDLAALPGLIAGVLVAAPLGVKFALRVPAHALKQAFGLVLIIVSVRMLWSAFF